MRHASGFGNLVSKGIIDPTKVVRVALEDGASIAGLDDRGDGCRKAEKGHAGTCHAARRRHGLLNCH